jgi:NAD(P)-dependent dehydrogenase (short-subunit alcohol dehydrogenase family)
MAPGSSIVLNGSVNAHIGMAGSSTYAASEAALISLTRTLSTELLEKGVRVNVVSPGRSPHRSTLDSDCPTTTSPPPPPASSHRSRSAASVNPTKSPTQSSSSPAGLRRSSSEPNSSSTAG